MAERKDIADQSKYPSGQAPRTPGQQTISSEVKRFREQGVMEKNDPNGTRKPHPGGPNGLPPNQRGR